MNNIEYDGMTFQEESHVFEYILGEALNIQCLGYNDEVTNNVWNVLTCIAKDGDNKGNLDIAKKLNLTEVHVELIQYLICNNDRAEYGTSPRYCWLTEKGKALYSKLLTWRPNEERS